MGRARVGIAVLGLLLLLGGLTVVALTGSRFAPDSAASAALPSGRATVVPSTGAATNGPHFTVPTTPGPNDLPTDLPSALATPAPGADSASAIPAPTGAATPGPATSAGPIPTPVPDSPPPTPASAPEAPPTGYTLVGIAVTVGKCLWDEETETTTCPVNATFNYAVGGGATDQDWSVVVDSDYCGPCGRRSISLPARAAPSFTITDTAMNASFDLLLTRRQTPVSCGQSFLHVATANLSSDPADFLGAQPC